MNRVEDLRVGNEYMIYGDVYTYTRRDSYRLYFLANNGNEVHISQSYIKEILLYKSKQRKSHLPEWL